MQNVSMSIWIVLRSLLGVAVLAIISVCIVKDSSQFMTACLLSIA